jgi:hypothetical protein
VLECLGTGQAIDMSIGVMRDGGTIGRVGATQYTDVPMGFDTLMRNITLMGGVAPAHAYVEDLLPDIVEGRIEAAACSTHRQPREVPDGYRAMADQQALKVLIRP